MEEELREAVLRASGRPEVGEAVGAIYAQLQDAIDLRRPICSASGRCCNFEEFGHRLYVTTMELAKFVADLNVVGGGWWVDRTEEPRQLPRALPILSTADPRPTTHNPQASCPFQIDRLCSVHTIRPFGCRVFFCDPTATDWQHEQYERHHTQLRRLHEELAVPYFYVEWRFALRTLGLTRSSYATFTE